MSSPGKGHCEMNRVTSQVEYYNAYDALSKAEKFLDITADGLFALRVLFLEVEDIVDCTLEAGIHDGIFSRAD